MLRRAFPFIIPLAVIIVVVGGFIAIGSLLLFVAELTAPDRLPPVWVALGLTLGTGAVCLALSFRAMRLPPVELPGEPPEPAPVRRLDLGAGYLVGQFIVIFGLMLALLFVTLALKQ